MRILSWTTISQKDHGANPEATHFDASAWEQNNEIFFFFFFFNILCFLARYENIINANISLNFHVKLGQAVVTTYLCTPVGMKHSVEDMSSKFLSQMFWNNCVNKHLILPFYIFFAQYNVDAYYRKFLNFEKENF